MNDRGVIARALKELPDGLVRWASAPIEALPRLPTGIESLDAALNGGWPRGRVSLLYGTKLSAGRTSLAAATVAISTARGSLTSWIDGDSSLDPASLLANGADISRVLWVRGPFSARKTLLIAEEVVRSGCFEVVVIQMPESQAPTPEWLRLSRAAEQARSVVLATSGCCPGALRVLLSDMRAVWSNSPLPILLGARAIVRLDTKEVETPLEARERFG